MPTSLSISNLLRTGLALALAGLVLTLAACGDSRDSASASSSSSDRDTARVRLQACLRKQGIDLPSPGQGNRATGPPPSFDRTRVQRAMQGPCKKYQQAAFGNISAQDRQERRDRLVKFSSCMRRNGVEVPDVQPGQGGPPQRLNLNSPGTRRATEACRSLLPRGPGGGPGAGGGQ